MRLLLDTHTLVWAAFTPAKLSRRARAAISDTSNSITVSAISAMEISTKVRLNRFELARPLATGFRLQMAAQGFDVLAVTADHGERAGNMIDAHQDPWDRLLLAQALIEDMVLVTGDAELGSLGAPTLW